MKKWLSSFTIIMSILVLGACNSDEETTENPAEETETAEEAAPTEGETEQPEAPEPDLEGVPDVVAEVNGTEIEKADFEEAYTMQFQQAAMMSQMSGEELNQDELKQQVANGLVSQELLIQEADNRGLTASEEDVNTVLDDIAAQNEMESQDDLFAAFEEQGTPEEEVLELVDIQVKVEQLVAEETGEIEPTEEELQELYDQFTAQMEQSESEEEVPSLEDMKPQLTEQVVAQKEGEAMQALVAELEESADITVHL